MRNTEKIIMRIQRVIHPVGQGAFYSERFFDDKNHVSTNVVYDCGSETTKSKITIKQLPDDKIDYFFLSHFHNDHFNGNEKFFNNSLQIDTLVLPQLSIEEAIYCLLSCNPSCKKSNQRLCELLSAPYTVARQIILVEPTNKTIRNDFLSGLQVNYRTHPSFKDISLPCKIWQYIPVYENIIDPVKVANRINDLKKSPLFSKYTSPQGILRRLVFLLLNQYDKVRHLLNGKDQNEFSMMLVSVPYNYETAVIKSSGICCGDGYKCRGEKHKIDDLIISKPGALYTGDIPMSIVKNTINQIIKTYGMVLGAYQIPHHGSALNYKSNLFPNSELHFLSAGTRNRYRHPTAMPQLNNLPILFSVTEKVTSRLTMNFTI